MFDPHIARLGRIDGEIVELAGGLAFARGDGARLAEAAGATARNELPRPLAISEDPGKRMMHGEGATLPVRRDGGERGDCVGVRPRASLCLRTRGSCAAFEWPIDPAQISNAWLEF